MAKLYAIYAESVKTEHGGYLADQTTLDPLTVKFMKNDDELHGRHHVDVLTFFSKIDANRFIKDIKTGMKIRNVDMGAYRFTAELHEFSNEEMEQKITKNREKNGKL